MRNDETLAPNPVRSSDIATLIGLLAELEGELMVAVQFGVDPPNDRDRYRKRFEMTGLLAPGGDERAFRQAINDMNQRLRYTIGEYSDPNMSAPVP